MSPSWLTSLALHFLVIIGLAVWSLPDLPRITANLLLAEPTDEESIEDLVLLDDVLQTPDDLSELAEELTAQPDTVQLAEEVSFSTFNEPTAAPSFTELAELGLETAPAVDPNDFEGFDGVGTSGRGQQARSALVRQGGGSPESETAVALSLRWLAEHQNPDGSWSLVHNRHACRGRCGNPSVMGSNPDPYGDSLRSATGLALLPFLGAGQTHQRGRHKKVVERGLAALVAMGQAKKQGAAWVDSGRLYAHGIAAIALTEAYGMTEDPNLRAPAQAAVNYIAAAQDPVGGGWRYKFREKGDTSVTGWQIMALKSASLSELSIPPSTIARATQFLDSVSTKEGARYGYQLVPVEEGAVETKVSKVTTPLTAVGLLCRMYMGWKQDNPALKQGIAEISRKGPSKNNYYYNYYAAQVLFQNTGGQGPVWRKWNEKLRDQLLEQQSTRGHLRGSWYLEGPHNARGGRLYTTSLAAMTLEVYYRYMPIYQTEAVSQEFPE